jgi:hypothetical protein
MPTIEELQAQAAQIASLKTDLDNKTTMSNATFNTLDDAKTTLATHVAACSHCSPYASVRDAAQAQSDAALAATNAAHDALVAQIAVSQAGLQALSDSI